MVSTDEVAVGIQDAVRAGGRAFRDQHLSLASGHLFDAIQIASRAEPGRFRNTELVKLGRLCLQARFEDLALIALVAAVSGFDASGDHLTAGSLMIEIATIFAQLMLEADEKRGTPQLFMMQFESLAGELRRLQRLGV